MTRSSGSVVRAFGRFLFVIGLVGLFLFAVFAILMVAKNADGGPEPWMLAWVPIGFVGAALAFIPVPSMEWVRDLLEWIKRG